MQSWGNLLSVRLHSETYREVWAYFVDRAVHRFVEAHAGELRHLPFEPYAPVGRLFLNIIRALNRARGVAGLEAAALKMGLETGCRCGSPGPATGWLPIGRKRQAPYEAKLYQAMGRKLRPVEDLEVPEGPPGGGCP